MVDEGSPDSHSTDLNISGEEGHCKTLKKEGTQTKVAASQRRGCIKTAPSLPH